jgi:hypothetical protein
VAITPSKSKRLSFEEVTRVCQTSTLAALEALHEAGVGRPFRFLYMSGTAAERDQSKTPSWMPEYSLMRVRTISPFPLPSFLPSFFSDGRNKSI